MSDHKLLMILAELYATMKGTSIEKYKYFHEHMGTDCPYTRKSLRAFQKRDKEPVMNAVEKFLEEMKQR